MLETGTQSAEISEELSSVVLDATRTAGRLYRKQGNNAHSQLVCYFGLTTELVQNLAVTQSGKIEEEKTSVKEKSKQKTSLQESNWYSTAVHMMQAAYH